jgi:hypothetical protein
MTTPKETPKAAKGGRRQDRLVKSLSLPEDLVTKIQAEADDKYSGDFTRAVMERLALIYPEAMEFLKENPTAKHSRKK